MEGANYDSKREKLLRTIMNEFHSFKIGGHAGIHRTVSRISA